MKDFLKNVFATVIGIAVFLMIMGLLGAISLVGMIASSDTTVNVKDNSVFVLSLKGTVDERAEETMPDALAFIQGGEITQMGRDQIISAIKKAKNNEDIKGIYVEAGVVQFDSYSTAKAIRDALADFRKSGKWVVAYADNYLQSTYYIASVADKVYMNKTGMLDLKGIGGKTEYMKGFYDKIGVKYQATRVGKYKSAVESMISTGMSDEDREQRMAYYSGLWKIILSDISASRKVSAENIDKLVSDSLLAFTDVNKYVSFKLIDKLMYPEELKAEIKKRIGLKDDEDINQLSLNDMNNVKSKENKEGEEIAVYYACGEIIDNETTGFLTSGSNIIGSKMAKDLNDLAANDDVKAVVIRVNSPGGSAAASEQIWHAVKLLKAKKPVVISMGGVAASGGYMISAGANYIFAEPTTLTGSIGIFGLIPNFSGLVTGKLGVTFDGAKTNRFTDFEENLIFSSDNETELQFMQGYVDRGYTNFLSIVADGRKMTKEAVHEIAQGRVWFASDALKIKLVDQLGTLDDAVAKAAKLAKVEEYHPTSYPAPASFMEQLMATQDKGSYLDAELREILGDAYEPIISLRRDAKRNRLQTRLPFSVKTE